MTHAASRREMRQAQWQQESTPGLKTAGTGTYRIPQ
jgi:hypothetical protein